MFSKKHENRDHEQLAGEYSLEGYRPPKDKAWRASCRSPE
jgi:hypothetical protein